METREGQKRATIPCQCIVQISVYLHSESFWLVEPNGDKKVYKPSAVSNWDDSYERPAKIYDLANNVNKTIDIDTSNVNQQNSIHVELSLKSK